MDILRNLEEVGPKRGIWRIWYDELEEAVGPKREEKSIWHDR